MWAKYTLATAKRAAEPIRTSVLQAIGEDLRAEIRKPAILEWIPARIFFDLMAAIARCDERTAIAFWRYSLNQSISQPLISTLVEGGIHLFGRSPYALYKRTPRAWTLVSRDCGDISVAEQTVENEAQLRLENVPAEFRHHRGLILLFLGGFQGQADFCQRRAEIEVDETHYRSSGVAEFLVRWW